MDPQPTILHLWRDDYHSRCQDLGVCYDAQTPSLGKSHLHILRQISVVRSSTAVSILLAEFGLMPLPDQWLLRTATFWNAIVALPPTSLYKKMALDACTWAACVSKAVRGTGYDFSIRQGALAHIDLQVLSSHLRRAGMLFGIIWTSALGPVLLRNHVSARTRTGLLGLRVATLGHFWTCPFPGAACSACCALGWAATSCPTTQDAGFVCRDKTGCVQCANRVS